MLAGGDSWVVLDEMNLLYIRIEVTVMRVNDEHLTGIIYLCHLLCLWREALVVLCREVGLQCLQ